MTETIAYWLLRALQVTPFRGNRNAFFAAGSQAATVETYPQAEIEAQNCAEFLGYLEGQIGDMRGLTLLDFGSGYGGKTVAIARALEPGRIIGIEPFATMVEKSRSYAAAQAAGNCEFRVCDERQIPAADGEFDALFSHDVIEHVADPEATIVEMFRVLRAGGSAYIIFTPYWGALAHHLGYVTRLPFIHWMFSARALVGAVNRLIAMEGGSRFRTVRQPPPKRSFNGTFDVLPSLNGIGSQSFLDLARRHGFELVTSHYPTIVERYLPRARALTAVNSGVMGLHPGLREALSFNFVCVLRKPSAPVDRPS